MPFTSILRSLKVAFGRPRLGALESRSPAICGRWQNCALERGPTALGWMELTNTTVRLFESASSQGPHLSRVEEEKDLKTVGSGSVDHQTAVKASMERPIRK
jgi:hypothetical protein